MKSGFSFGRYVLTLACMGVSVAGLAGHRAQADEGCQGRIDELSRQVAELRAQLDLVAGTRVVIGSNGQQTRLTRDYSTPALGEAYRDPSGMIWGDILKKADGTPATMTLFEAKRRCQAMGAQLPSKEDFRRLRRYLDQGGTAGYVAQVLPNLKHSFWVSEVYRAYEGSDMYFETYFDGKNGSFESSAIVDQGARPTVTAARCVRL